MRAIILAAGRGSRMSGLTDGKPKCLVEIAGKPLLFWQLEALSAAGLGPIAVVCGYRAELIEALRSEAPTAFATLLNSRWAETNMLSTLFAAADWIAGEECVISYSDIVYPAAHVKALMSGKNPMDVTYDTRWEELWRLRHGNPLDDAETFRQENGLIQEIGGKPECLEQVQGQYMGLFKLTPEGWETFNHHKAELGDAVNRTDMTSFIRRLLAAGVKVGAVPVAGRWCEVDSEKDLRLYERELAGGSWEHDWR